MPTYNKDIAPILWKNCAGCHRTGEIGPFSLLTYKDAAKRSSFLAEITASRRMPPWKPEPGFGSFHDERRLSDAEIQKIAAWAEAGAPEGNRQRPAPAAQVSRGLAARHARPRAQSVRAVRRARRKGPTSIAAS